MYGVNIVVVVEVYGVGVQILVGIWCFVGVVGFLCYFGLVVCQEVDVFGFVVFVVFVDQVSWIGYVVGVGIYVYFGVVVGVLVLQVLYLDVVGGFDFILDDVVFGFVGFDGGCCFDQLYVVVQVDLVVGMVGYLFGVDIDWGVLVLCGWCGRCSGGYVYLGVY